MIFRVRNIELGPPSDLIKIVMMHLDVAVARLFTNRSHQPASVAIA
jgi:hypothetical protein